jgi:hypothetical protein
MIRFIFKMITLEALSWDEEVQSGRLSLKMPWPKVWN